MVRALEQQRGQLRIGCQHMIAKQAKQAFHGVGQILDLVEREKGGRAFD